MYLSNIVHQDAVLSKIIREDLADIFFECGSITIMLFSDFIDSTDCRGIHPKQLNHQGSKNSRDAILS